MKKLLPILLILIFSFIAVPFAQGDPGSLYLAPSAGTYTVGSTFSIVVKVNTGEIAINAAEGSLVYDPDKLEVTALSKAGSIFSLWTTEPVFSNSSGSISFGGGVPNPGFSGASGSIITITFKAKRAAAAQVNFSSGAVLANDGKGTNILTSMSGGNYTLAPETVTPEPEPTPTPTPTPTPLPPTPGQVPEAPVIIGHPTEWRAESSPILKWELPSDVNGVSIKLDKKPKSDPGPLSDGLFTEKPYEDLEDGIWYFHIKFRNRSGWGSTIHHKISIDTAPPEPFEITVDNEGDLTNPTPILHFKAEDKTSGIEYYEVKIGEGDALSIADVEQNPFKMPPQAPGKHTTIVEAVDKAGNSTLATKEVIIEPIESPVITRLPEKLKPGDILSLGGKTFPNSTVTIFVQKEGEEPIRTEVKTDSEGNWAYIHPESVEKGIYRIWAEVKDSRGALSSPSAKIALAAELPSLFKIGDIVIDYLTIMITLIALIILVVLVAIYGWAKIVSTRRRLRKEVGEAEEALRDAFDALREKVEELVSEFDSRPGLSAKERKVRDKLNNALGIAQKFIGKEIKDVGKEVE